ncbi:MAG: hypothetical protein Q4A46_09190 [Clostridia bacterium]|nr:hypothetical protein [Clostridia bacterium]
MKKKKTYRRVSKNSIVEPDIELCTVMSNDCTGMVPSAIIDDFEQDAYEDIYPYETNPYDTGDQY